LLALSETHPGRAVEYTQTVSRTRAAIQAGTEDSVGVARLRGATRMMHTQPGINGVAASYEDAFLAIEAGLPTTAIARGSNGNAVWLEYDLAECRQIVEWLRPMR